jgi:transposase InsO family protein
LHHWCKLFSEQGEQAFPGCGHQTPQEAEEPNSKWVTDTKAVETAEGWLYLAVILDLFSRMVVGWAMAATEDEQLVELALRMALVRRHPPKRSLSLHSACSAEQEWSGYFSGGP